MTFSSGSFGQLSFIPEVTRGVLPTTGNAVNLRMTSPTMKAAIATVKSAEIRADRLSSGLTRVDQDVDGGFDFELSAKEYDPFLEGLFGQSFKHFGVLGLGVVFSMTSTASTVTASAATTGSSIFTLLAKGSWFKLVAPSTAASAVKKYFADAWFKVSSTVAPTATIITLDASTPITAPGIIGGSVTGYAISQSEAINSSTRKTFSMQYALSDVAQHLLYTGMEVNTMDLQIDVGAMITGSFGFIGQGHEVGGATFMPGTPVASQAFEVMNAVTDVGTIYENGTNLLAGGSFIRSLSLSVNNNARGQKAVGVFGNAGVGLGELELGGSMEVYFQDATYYNKWLNGTNTKLSIGFADAAGNGYLIDLDKVSFTDGALNPGGASDDVMLTLPFSAFYDPVTQRGIRITRAVAA